MAVITLTIPDDVEMQDIIEGLCLDGGYNNIILPSGQFPPTKQAFARQHLIKWITSKYHIYKREQVNASIVIDNPEIS